MVDQLLILFSRLQTLSNSGRVAGIFQGVGSHQAAELPTQLPERSYFLFDNSHMFFIVESLSDIIHECVTFACAFDYSSTVPACSHHPNRFPTFQIVPQEGPQVLSNEESAEKVAAVPWLEIPKDPVFFRFFGEL